MISAEAYMGGVTMPMLIAPPQGLPPDAKYIAYPVYNVKGFGAKGDGVTDDSAAIQAAIDAAYAGGGIVFIPAGRYLLNTPLNITNKDRLSVLGAGPMHTVLLGNTGGVVVDLTGARNVLIANLKVTNLGAVNPSTVGLLFARSQSVQNAEFNCLENVYVDFSSIPSANGGNGTLGIYNYGAELWRAWNIYIVADKPLTLTNENAYSVLSPFTSIFTAVTSMSVSGVYGNSTLRAHNGPAIWLHSCWQVEAPTLYLTSSAGNPYLYAIRVSGVTRSIRLSGNAEMFPRLLIVDNTTVENMYVDFLHVSDGSPQIVLDGTVTASGITGGSIRVLSYGGVAHSLISVNGPQNGVRGCIIYMQSYQTLDIPGGYTTDLIIISESDRPVVNLSGSPGFYSALILKRGSQEFKGQLDLAQGVTIGGGQKISAHLSVTANLNFPAPAAVPGSVDAIISVPGAAFGDTVTVGAPVAVGPNYILTAFVSAPDRVTVRWTQIAGLPADPDGAGGVYRVDVWKH